MIKKKCVFFSLKKSVFFVDKNKNCCSCRLLYDQKSSTSYTQYSIKHAAVNTVHCRTRLPMPLSNDTPTAWFSLVTTNRRAVPLLLLYAGTDDRWLTRVTNYLQVWWYALTSRIIPYTLVYHHPLLHTTTPTSPIKALRSTVYITTSKLYY